MSRDRVHADGTHAGDVLRHVGFMDPAQSLAPDGDRCRGDVCRSFHGRDLYFHLVVYQPGLAALLVPEHHVPELGQYDFVQRQSPAPLRRLLHPVGFP